MLASLISLSIDFFTSSYLLVVLLLISLPTLYFLFFISSPPDAPPSFHFLTPALTGRFHLHTRGPLDLVHAGYSQLGDCFRLRLLHKHMTVMVGPEANQLVFEAKDSILSQQEVYSFTVPVFGRNIVYDAPRPVMQQQLKFTAKGLNTEHMQRHADKIVREAEEFFAHWGEQGEVDLLEEFSRLIILTASRCLLGDEIRNSVHAHFAELYQTLSDGMSHISFFWPYAPTKAHAARDAARQQIRAIFAPVIAKRRAETEAEQAEHDDFLQVLIESKYTDGTSATDEEIGGMLLAALFGGQHTSNITSTWLGLHIIQQKHSLMRRLLDEQREVLGDDEHPTFTSLSQMDLLAASMKETLRMSPHTAPPPPHPHRCTQPQHHPPADAHRTPPISPMLRAGIPLSSPSCARRWSPSATSSTPSPKATSSPLSPPSPTPSLTSSPTPPSSTPTASTRATRTTKSTHS